MEMHRFEAAPPGVGPGFKKDVEDDDDPGSPTPPTSPAPSTSPSPSPAASMESQTPQTRLNEFQVSMLTPQQVQLFEEMYSQVTLLYLVIYW